MLTALWIVAVLTGFLALAYVNASGRAWAAGIAVALAVSWLVPVLPLAANLLLTVAFVVLALPLAVPALRRRLVSDGVLSAFRKMMPAMSQTEREALEAGTVWWDGELFSGRPDWKGLLATPRPTLTPEEQRFLDVDTEELCALSSDWAAATHSTRRGQEASSTARRTRLPSTGVRRAPGRPWASVPAERSDASGAGLAACARGGIDLRRFTSPAWARICSTEARSAGNSASSRARWRSIGNQANA